jgi:HD superfamily phosphohydrolase
MTNYERVILDTREMQRLRFIKQLGLTNMVYDSAEHSRLSHSVGCVARVEQILRTIEDHEGIKVDDELRLTARLYALTHDVTHIAFGHTLEDEFGFFPKHDNNGPRTERLIFRDSSELGQALRGHEIGRTVMKLFDPDASSAHTGAVIDLVSGLTGADVLDYIDRDAYFCGLAHRVDSAIFRQFRLQPLPRTDGRRLISKLWDQYGVRLDREFAVENVLEQRYAMFLKVYAHRTKIAASALLAKGLAEAMYPSKTTRPLFREENLEELGVGDTVVLDRMRQSRKAAVKLAADQLVRRKLPTGVYRAVLLDKEARTEHEYLDRWHRLEVAGLFDPRTRASTEAEIAREAKLDASQVMVYCPSVAPGYKRVEHWVLSARDASPIREEYRFGLQVAKRHLGLWELWVFVSHGVEDRAKGIVMDHAQGKFGFPNMIDTDRRQGKLW